MTDLRFDFKNHSRSFVGGYLVEICAAIQNDAPRLAAIGMRSLLEHVMIQNVGDHGTFGKNLDEFRKAGFLSQTQADYLAKTLEGGQPIPGEGLQCQADMNKWTKWETLGAIMGLMLRRSGFPLASPNGPRSVDPPFRDLATACSRLRGGSDPKAPGSNPPEPACTIAIRAELRLEEHIYWSSKIIFTEARAGKDEQTKSKDVHLRTRDAMLGLAEQFMADWIAAGGQRVK